MRSFLENHDSLSPRIVKLTFHHRIGAKKTLYPTRGAVRRNMKINVILQQIIESNLSFNHTDAMYTMLIKTQT